MKEATGPHPLRARELTTPHPEGLTTRLVPVEVDLKQQIFDVCSSLNNGHSPKGRVRQLCATSGSRGSLLISLLNSGSNSCWARYRLSAPALAFPHTTRSRGVKLKAVAQTWTNGRPRHRERIAARSIVGAQTTLFQLEISSGRGQQSRNQIDEGQETSS